MIVVDASLATKWVLREVYTDRAFAFLDRHGADLAAPDILLNEVAGALVSRCNRRLLDKADALGALSQWTGFWADGLLHQHRVSADLARHAAELAIALGNPIADCIYLALAIELESDLATCDVKFHARASKHFTEVRLLDEFDVA